MIVVFCHVRPDCGRGFTQYIKKMPIRASGQAIHDSLQFGLMSSDFGSNDIPDFSIGGSTRGKGVSIEYSRTALKSCPNRSACPRSGRARTRDMSS